MRRKKIIIKTLLHKPWVTDCEKEVAACATAITVVKYPVCRNNTPRQTLLISVVILQV